MKVWIWLVVTIGLSWRSSIEVESASIVSPEREANDNSNDCTITFKIDVETSSEDYSKFVGDLRNKVKSDKESYEIPILFERSKVVSDKKYLMVDLTYLEDTIRLAIDVVNMYFVAYKAGNKSYFFKDFLDLRSVLFTDTKQLSLPFTTQYSNLGGRENVELGKYALRRAIKALYEYNENNLKKSIVTVIQMVSEAARFRLIQRTVRNNFPLGFIPLCNIFSYEDNWGKLSRAIQESKDGTFNPIKLQKPDCTDKEVTKVSQVKQNMGILLFAEQENFKQESLEILQGDQQEESLSFIM